MHELNTYRFHVPLVDEGTFQFKREFCSDISAFAFAAVKGATMVEKFDYLNVKWEQVTNIEIDQEFACYVLAKWFDMTNLIDATMLDAISAGIIALKEAQLKDA